MRWQRIARLAIAVAAIAFLAVAASSMKRRMAPQTALPVPRTDPEAIVESAGGHTVRISGSKEDGLLQYDRLLTYANGSSKMVGVSITSQRNGKTFVLHGDEGQAGENDATFELNGNVKLEATDGMVLTADRATYVKADNLIQVPGAAAFTRGRTSGSGIGLTYDQLQDVITIGDRAQMEITADEAGKGGMTLASGALEFRRMERIVRLDRAATITREQQTVSADQAFAHLNADESGVELLELRNNSRITAAPGGAGALQSMSGRNVDLRYREGGETQSLERAVIDGDAVLQLAGDSATSSRQISAGALNIGLGSNGTTPTELAARNNVRVTLPADGSTPARTINAQALDSNGPEARGLTSAHFTNNVQFAERGANVNRAARSAVLDVTMSGGFGTIDEAVFTRGVRFADGPLLATAAAARYSVAKGSLELTGSEPGSPSPHVINDRITVDSTRVELTLDGPIVHAAGAVKSVLQPAGPANASGKGDTHLPRMLKEDQPVNVAADQLEYDGKASRAVYRGNALLWQTDTSIKGTSITIDSASGDLAAEGPVATSAVLLQDDGAGKKEKVPSIGTSKAFSYLDTSRKATYTGDAHITGPQGDLTSPRVELFLQPSGDELDRAEAYDGVTLRGDGRKTTGQRLTYFSADQRYLVTGSPVTILEECGRETVGRTLTFFKTADRIIVDGNEQIRTQTRGKSNCP